MANAGRRRAESHGVAGMFVTVVRGHTEEATYTFEFGAEREKLSVGSRGDWNVSGPGVLPVHLWLAFDGLRLLAASGDAPAYLQGRELSAGWNAVSPGQELRFGFALLRVTGEPPRRVAHGTKTPWSQPRRLTAALAATLVSALTLALVLAKPAERTPPPPAVASAESRPSRPGEGDAAPASLTITPASPTLPEVRPAAPSPALVDELLEPPSRAPLLTGPAEPAKLAEDAPSPALKPRAAYPQNIANRPIPRVGEQPWLISEEWRAQHERQLHARGRAEAKVIFLGDSITESWAVAPAYREQFGKYSPLNLGIASDTTQNVLWRLEHGALDGTHPSAVVLMIGINNLAGGFSAQQTVDGVAAIVASIQARLPTARVLLLGVLPARQDAANPLRQTVKDANRLLASLAKPGHVELHDVGSILLEPDGAIAKTTMRDFVHPTAEGFQRLSLAVAPVLDSWMTAGNQ